VRRQSDPAAQVVVTGMGCVTPLGMDLRSTWEAASEGRSGVTEVTHFDASPLPVRIAAEVKREVELSELSIKEARRLDPVVRFAFGAAREALADSRLEVTDANRDRVGVAIGSGIGGLTTIISNHRTYQKHGIRRISPFTIAMGIANMPSGMVSIQYGLRGPNLCHVSACSSGAHAIGESARMIARGDADVMVAGGSEAPILDLGLAGFAAMRALSTRNDEPQRASRPFDPDRDGFVMGEGAAVLVRERLEHARARGARVRGEVMGYAATGDAAHIAAPEASGEGARRCMQLALEDAGIDVAQLDAVNAHATSTPTGDPIEAKALREVLGSHVERVPVSATKSMTGHLLGASGAVEAVLSLAALEEGLLPPTINLDRVAPDCELNHVAGKARRASAQVALSNSFGFGGTNVSLVFGAARRL